MTYPGHSHRFGLTVIAVVFGLGLAAPTFGQAQAPAAPQFQDLFNGKDLAGWTNINTAPDTWAWRGGVAWTTGERGAGTSGVAPNRWIPARAIGLSKSWPVRPVHDTARTPAARRPPAWYARPWRRWIRRTGP